MYGQHDCQRMCTCNSQSLIPLWYHLLNLVQNHSFDGTLLRGNNLSDLHMTSIYLAENGFISCLKQSLLFVSSSSYIIRTMKHLPTDYYKKCSGCEEGKEIIRKNKHRYHPKPTHWLNLNMWVSYDFQLRTCK